jgi:hypothetical protein
MSSQALIIEDIPLPKLDSRIAAVAFRQYRSTHDLVTTAKQLNERAAEEVANEQF